ncbi:MAG: hypothetical protein WAZ77_18555 [Candidatus Nitrosopolaris sp.]|jgi:hypothetical protein
MDKEKLVFESDTLMNKKVVSSDLEEVGNIISVDNDSLKILRGADNHYIIPKSRVKAFIGDEMLVNFRLNDLLLVELASLSYID